MSFSCYPFEKEPEGVRIEDDPILCELCDEPCADDFHFIKSVIVCGWCMKNCENITENINNLKNLKKHNHGNLQKITASPRNH